MYIHVICLFALDKEPLNPGKASELLKKNNFFTLYESLSPREEGFIVYFLDDCIGFMSLSYFMYVVPKNSTLVKYSHE